MLFWVYNLLFLPAALVYLAWFALSNRRALLKGFAAELGERLACYPAPVLERLSGRPLVWFHAASLGEVKALEPMIARLRGELPRHALVLTASNIVAREQGRRIAGLDAVFLAPLDFYPLARRAVRLLQPRALVIAETELWPSLLRAARRAGARLAMVNARMSARSSRRYAWAGSLLREMLGGLDLVCAQTALDAARFLALGAREHHTASVGNLKHDRFFEEIPDLAPVRERLRAAGFDASAPLFVAGSTHKGEEQAALAALLGARARVPSARLLLAPRHLERLEEVVAAVRAAGLRPTLWSRPEPGADVLVLDAVGVLPALYGAARAAFVGGTLVPRGGHNLLEPVRFSVPVLFGPYTDNVRDVAEVLLRSGGGLRVSDPAALVEAVSALLPDPARCRDLGERARAAADSLRGATERTLSTLLPLL